jgi:hypothetical protein
MAGRPTKFTPELGAKICKWITAGVSIEAAAEAEGVARATVYNWRDRGHAGEQPFVDFVVDLEKAQGRIEARLTLNITQRAKDDWRAGAWYLERRRAERFGEQGKLERKLEDEYERLIDAARRELDPDSYQKLLRALARPRGTE